MFSRALLYWCGTFLETAVHSLPQVQLVSINETWKLLLNQSFVAFVCKDTNHRTPAKRTWILIYPWASTSLFGIPLPRKQGFPCLLWGSWSSLLSGWFIWMRYIKTTEKKCDFYPKLFFFLRGKIKGSSRKKPIPGETLPPAFRIKHRMWRARPVGIIELEVPIVEGYCMRVNCVRIRLTIVQRVVLLQNVCLFNKSWFTTPTIHMKIR